MSDLCVKFVATEASARVHVRAIKRIVLEIIDSVDPSKRAGRRLGGGVHADPAPEAFVGYRFLPMAGVYAVGPFPQAVARILDGRQLTIGAQTVTFDVWPLVTSAGGSNCFDLDDVAAEWATRQDEPPETGD